MKTSRVDHLEPSFVLVLLLLSLGLAGPDYFVGVGVSDPLVVASLVETQDALVAKGITLGRENSSSFHFTIALLQANDLGCVRSALTKALQSVRCRNQTLRGLGSFPGPTGAVRVIYAMAEGDSASFVNKLNQLVSWSINASCPNALWADNPNSFHAHCSLFVGGQLGVSNVTLSSSEPLFGNEMVSEVFVKTVGQGNKLVFSVPLQQHDEL